MCFSATASFATSVVLVPLGSFALVHAYQFKKQYLALAAMPLLFGIQQMFEGALWLVLDDQLNIAQHIPALGFLFFAYFLWPFYVPLAAFFVEEDRVRRRIFLAVAAIGLIVGVYLYVPLLVSPEWLSLRIHSGSIFYEPKLIFDNTIPIGAHRIGYALIVALPLLFSTVVNVRLFGFLILFSVIVSAVSFAYAFVSIWCFFAALLSIYLAYVIYSMEYLHAEAA